MDLEIYGNTSGENERIYENPDGQTFYDEKTGSFMEGFTKQQQLVLKNAMEEGKPAGLVAYPCITAERMKTLLSYARPESLLIDRGGVKAQDIYKCGQLDISPEKTKLIMETVAAMWHIKPIDECDDVTKLDEEALSLIAEAARNGKDLCKDANRLPLESFKTYARKVVDKIRRNNRIENTIDRIRFKEHFDIKFGASPDI